MTHINDRTQQCDVRSEVYLDDKDLEIDDMGNFFEACPMSDNGHLFFTRCGETVCVHCEKVVG